MSWADLVIYFGPGANAVCFFWTGATDAGYRRTEIHGELDVGAGLQFTRLPIDLVLDATPVLLLGGFGPRSTQETGLVVSAHVRWYF